MEKFIKGLDESLVEKGVKERMLKVGFNRTLVNAAEAAGCSSYSVNAFDSALGNYSAETVIKVIKENGFKLVDKDGVLFTHEDEKTDGMTSKDVAFYFFDTLNQY